MSADFFDRFETELVAAAGRRARRRVRFGGPLAFAGAVVVAGGALAATGAIELGTPDRPVRHSAQAAGRGLGVPQPGTARLLGVRTADPIGGPPWGIRVYRSSRAYPCAQYGRVVGGRLVRIGRDGKAHELALRCRGNSSPGSFGNTRVAGREIFYGYVGPRARRVIIARSTVLPVRDGAFLAVYNHGFQRLPRVTAVLDDGSRHLLGPDAPPVPGATPPHRPVPPPVEHRPIKTSARTISPDGSVLVTFRAPLAVRDVLTFYRAEANGPHGNHCDGRVLAATDRNHERGELVHLRLRTGSWCRGHFRGRVSVGLRRTVGRFSLTVR
jgi:hypothetical protein